MPVIEALSETSLAYDNDVFTLLRNDNKFIRGKISTHFSNTKQLPAIPSFVIFESFQGIEQSLSKRKITLEQSLLYKQKIEKLIQEHDVLDFNGNAAKIAAFICARIGSSRCNTLWYDILIVATALAHRYGLATKNKKDMELIAQYLPEDNNLLQLAIWKQ